MLGCTLEFLPQFGILGRNTNRTGIQVAFLEKNIFVNMPLVRKSETGYSHSHHNAS
jgi:hypothetical protein